jgi:anti-anti-sigma factor
LSAALGEAERAAAHSRVVLDLSAVTFMDSSGVKALLKAIVPPSPAATSVLIRRRFAPQVTRVLGLVGVLELLPYAD